MNVGSAPAAAAKPTPAKVAKPAIASERGNNDAMAGLRDLVMILQSAREQLWSPQGERAVRVCSYANSTLRNIVAAASGFFAAIKAKNGHAAISSVMALQLSNISFSIAILVDLDH
ncbi:MAG: hypothetical protein ACRC20_15665 [Segniliparus sp.]|uniref:hypothetical protein n=1 Tax=Segniliparus sp. TaxID=2804064 RepID=UPI003F32663A